MWGGRTRRRLDRKAPGGPAHGESECGAHASPSGPHGVSWGQEPEGALMCSPKPSTALCGNPRGQTESSG